jgi:hypothetical protein
MDDFKQFGIAESIAQLLLKQVLPNTAFFQ